MITRIKSDRIILRDAVTSGYLYFEDDKIIAVTPDELPFDSEIDATGSYVSPGFIDIHTHGGNGYDFINSADDVINGTNFHLLHGTTSICPTLSAAPFEKMARAVEYTAEAMTDSRTKANILGVHMEGPYLSAAQCGAQCPDFITPPDPDDYVPLVEKHGDAIARWSYAPENDAGGEFCKYITSKGIVASAGHTDAIYDDIKTASENGCRLVTHLYSCTSTISRDHGFRRLGVIESVYLDDSMYAEIIADGKHLPPELIRLILKIKGTDRIALVTDSLSLAGTNVKQGKMVDTDFIIEDGVCKLLDRSAFAGSIATADRLVRVIRDEVGMPIEAAVRMMTAVPAEIMGINKGELASGRDADIVIFDDDINISRVFVMGKQTV